MPRYSSRYLEIKRKRCNRTTNRTSNESVEEVVDDHERSSSCIKEDLQAIDKETIEPVIKDIKNSSHEEDNFTEVLRQLEMTQTKFQNEIINCAPRVYQSSIETTDVASRLLESMKSMIVQEESNSLKDSSIIWDDSKSQSEVSEIMAKFPRETKTAMMVLLNRSKNKPAQKKFDVKQIDTQTSLRTSPTELYLPCVKNLLCTKGYHSGSCEGDSSAPTSYNSNLNINFVENNI
ncbi:hypothetical protein FQR65_LT14177 [Abscondita terminalis]|nr:hypothetical protein FQR65_LT14177 [Abscondita terminalis]